MCYKNILLYQRWDSNPGPLVPKSDALTTMLCRRKECAILSRLFVPLLGLFLCKQPQRLPVATEVTSDLNSELSGPNNPCSSASLGAKCFFEPFKRKKGRKEERKEGRRQNRLVDLHARTSPQVKRSLKCEGAAPGRPSQRCCRTRAGMDGDRVWNGKLSL